jgi:hypothetical protein
MEHEKTPSEQIPSDENDRREFLKKCGRFAAVTPPAITMLLSTSLTSNAIAKSGGVKLKGNNGWGNGGGDGINKGSSKGGGVSAGGQGSGQSQSATKKADRDR